MKKFILTSTGKEVNIGDTITLASSIDLPFFGKIEGLIEKKLTKELLLKLIFKNKIKIISDEDLSYSKIWDNIIDNLSNKLGVNCINFLDLVEKADKCTFLTLILREIKIQLEKKYSIPIEKSKKIYSISFQTGKIIELDKKTIKNYNTLIAFRTLEDAKIAHALVDKYLKVLLNNEEK